MIHWLTPRRASWLAAAFLLVSSIAVIQATGDRHVWDDWWLDSALHGRDTMGTLGPWDLFRFANGDWKGLRVDEGPAPWFTHPDLKLALFRPLTTLTHVIDHHLMGFASIGALVQNAVWLALLLAAAGRLFLRQLPAPMAALGLVLLALEPSHIEPLGWVSGRNAVIGAALGFWGLVLHIEGHEDESVTKRRSALLLFALALLAGETALGCVLFLGSYIWLGRTTSASAKLRESAPYVLLLTLWLAVYAALGYGTRASGFYANPLSEPLAYLAELPAKFAAISSGSVLGFPTTIWFFRGDLRAPISILGAVALGLAGLGLAWVIGRAGPQERRSLVWLAVGTLSSQLPQCAGILGARSLVVPTLGASALVAAILLAPARELSTLRAWSARSLQALLALSHLAQPLLGLFATLNVYDQAFAAEDRAMQQSELDRAAGRRAIVLAAPDPTVAIYLPSRLALEGKPLPLAWNTLSFAEVDHRLIRTAENEFELEQLAEPRAGFEQAFRSDRTPLHPGDVVDLGFVRATVLDVEGRWRRKVRFSFTNLSDPKHCFLLWKDGALRETKLPGVGETLDLPWTKGPWSLF